MRKTGFWIALVGGLLTLALLGCLLVKKTAVSGTARIWQDGVLIHTIDLDAVDQPYSITVTASDGGVNVIQVEPGRVCVTEADCPDGVCVAQGWISDSSAPIACLPHGLIVEITGRDGGVDGTT